MLVFLTGILILPALLINLGRQPFIDDEGIRALVAYEMMDSGDWIHTTMNGEAYYKKPPLYNWFLAATFTLSGRVDEWSARIPTVLFLLAFLALIYRSVHQYTGDRSGAFLIAAMTLTCGRFLFWDSFLGLIDTAFSLSVYGMWMWMYQQARQEAWWSYFLGAWTIATLGFLLKGLPAAVFLGLSIPAHLLALRRGRSLFHPGQFAGAAIFGLVIGAYLIARIRTSDATAVLGTLFTESVQRTPANHGIADVLGHLFSFPLEMTYHFLPWSLLCWFILFRKTGPVLPEHPFLRFSALMLLVNLPVYWISPDVFPRYLLMFLPLAFLWGWEAYRNGPARARSILAGVFTTTGLILAAAAWLPLFLPQTSGATGLLAKTLVLALLLGGTAWIVLRHRELWMFGLVVQLLTLRVAFNWFVIPDRIRNDFGTLVREDAVRIGERMKDRPLVWQDQILGSPTTWYYLNTSRQAITPGSSDPPLPGQPFLSGRYADLPDGARITDTLRIRHSQDTFVLVCEMPSEL